MCLAAIHAMMDMWVGVQHVNSFSNSTDIFILGH